MSLYDIPRIADQLADALLAAAQSGHLAKVGIEDIRSAIVGYASGRGLPRTEWEDLEMRMTRKLVEKVG